MKINDHILMRMIDKDMQSKKANNYHIKDEVVVNPKVIKVGANEVVYVCYCYAESKGGFNLNLESGTDLIGYHEKNTIKQKLTPNTAYHSSQITAHWSSIKIKAKVSAYYFIRYIRITLQKQIPHEKS